MDQNNKKTLSPAVIAAIVLAIISALMFIGIITVSIFLFNSKSETKAIMQEKQEMEELVALEKEEMRNDLALAQTEYQELIVKINNDSLKFKLEREQMRTQALIEELERTKATNYAEITRLKKELKTLREVLKDYTRQIAELSRENENLKQENTVVNEKYKKAAKQIDNLANEKEKLTEKVSLASQLDASDIKITLLRKNGRDTKNIKKAKQIKISFTIAKNITSSTGNKTAYVRILQPDYEPLKKSEANTFAYENRMVSYSIKKEFEYNSQEITLDMYWNIEETLQEGEYQAFIFVDGNMIGKGSANFE
jgi:DNA repair exonuclease SbcCD ATPase subunit